MQFVCTAHMCVALEDREQSQHKFKKKKQINSESFLLNYTFVLALLSRKLEITASLSIK